MTVTRDWKSELPHLLERLIDGEFTSEDWTQLNECISQGDQPRRYYHSYMRLHAGLEWRIGERATTQGVCPWMPNIADQLPFPSFAPRLTDRRQTPSSFPILLSTTLHATLGGFPEGMPLAYLVATVVTGLGLLISSLVSVSPPEPVARNAVPAMVVEPKAEYVGRITGMADCKWEKTGLGVRDWGLEKGSGFRIQDGTENHQSSTFQSLILNPQSLVSLGDRFTLASGLMEITYDTGAKVILQGPVTYEVESNGGYLAVGKLTGKLGNRERGERRGARDCKSSIINHQSSIV